MIGKQIGKYEIQSILGKGGMGIVFRGLQTSLNRQVAIKMLYPHLVDEQSILDRFKREAYAIAKLNHPNIAHVYDIEEAEGTFFLIMEYIDGLNLDEYIRQTGLPDLADGLSILLQVASGLDLAHQNGIVHRDIKNSNLMIHQGLNIKIMDFGIARMEDNLLRTSTGLVLGTPKYMSPEQARGEKVDERSDIYSLGIVAFQLLTGVFPFDGNSSTEIMRQHLDVMPVRPTSIKSDLPGELERIILKLLAKDPAERYQRLPELTCDLQNFLRQHPEYARSVTPQARETEFKRTRVLPHAPATKKSTWRTIALTLIIFLVLTGGLFGLWQARQNGSLDSLWPRKQTELVILHPSELKEWLNIAVKKFEETRPNKEKLPLKLVSLSSGNAIDQLLHGQIQPTAMILASDYWFSILADRWAKEYQPMDLSKTKTAFAPFDSKQTKSLLLSCPVMITWEDRAKVLLKKFPHFDLNDAYQLAVKKTAWAELNGNPAWGFFRLGQTDPRMSNLGLASLALIVAHMAQTTELKANLLDRPDIQTFVQDIFLSSITFAPENSDDLMSDLLLLGPGRYDLIIESENVAIQYLPKAENKWQPIQLIYPVNSMMFNFPFAIMTAPWVTKEQKTKAQTFLEFLLDIPMQTVALTHGFRPTNMDVSIKEELLENPFYQFRRFGVKQDVGTIIENFTNPAERIRWHDWVTKIFQSADAGPIPTPPTK
jgi:serine/threonine-protein kinase